MYRFLKKNFKLLNPKIYRRGYAYWTWKPYLVEKVLTKLDDGDILVYSDGGNHFEYNALPRFEEYLSMMSLDKPILAFQQPYLEKDWTKMDVFKQVCPNSYLSFAMTLQLWGGCFILMKSNLTIELLKAWNDIRINHIDLFTDKRSTQSNLEGFHENRHDQSIFSMLVKQLPHIEISWEEVEPLDGNWDGFEKSPIQGKTGTAQNRGHDHSVFMGFAPMNDPRIAIAVYVENGGWGADYGVPIGDLMMEQYIKGKLSPASEAKAAVFQKKRIAYGSSNR